MVATQRPHSQCHIRMLFTRQTTENNIWGELEPAWTPQPMGRLTGWPQRYQVSLGPDWRGTRLHVSRGRERGGERDSLVLGEALRDCKKAPGTL